MWTSSQCSQSTSQFGVSGQGLFEDDAGLEAREGGAEADVGSEPKREVAIDRAFHVEAVGVVEFAGSRPVAALMRTRTEPAGQDLVVDGDVLFDDAGEAHGWWFVAEDLFNRARDQLGVFDELGSLVGVGPGCAHPPMNFTVVSFPAADNRSMNARASLLVSSARCRVAVVVGQLGGESTLIMSSVGRFLRSATYPTKSRESSRPTRWKRSMSTSPSSRWNFASVRRRMSSRSASGTPSISLMTSPGRRAPKSATKSKAVASACSSRSSRVNLRTLGS